VSGAGLLFSLSISFSVIEFLLAAFCGRYCDHSNWDKHQENSAGDSVDEANCDEGFKGKWRAGSLF
jgi:hypothetical protein